MTKQQEQDAQARLDAFTTTVKGREFGLKGHAGRFRVHIGNSFISECVPQLIVQRFSDAADKRKALRAEDWLDFCRCTIEELQQQIEHFEINVVILDQFTGPSPYELNKLRIEGTPLKWEEFLSQALNGEFNGTVSWRHARFTDELQPRLDMAESAYRADAQNNVELFNAKWDSSG